MNRFLIQSSLCFLLVSSSAYATLEEANQALKEKDFIFAMEEYTRLATKEGDTEAFYQIGRMYEQGLGVPKDQGKALDIYQQAADKGSQKAALKIGNAYYQGVGLPKNYVDAFTYFKKAADQRNHLAQYNVGLMFEEGLGVKKDPVEAFKYYLESGNQGYMMAQAALGKMFVGGIGTPQDYTQAIMWYRLAADQGDVDSQIKLAELYSNTTLRGLPFNVVGAHVYYNIVAAYAPSPFREQAIASRDQVVEKMRPEDVVIAQTLAQKWKKKTQEDSLPKKKDDGGIELGEEGGGPKKKSPEKEAVKEVQIEISAKTPVDEILVFLGVSRRDINRAVRENNFTEIIGNITNQANADNDMAMIALGDLYVSGQGVAENPKEAFSWYKKATEKKNAIAMYRLAPMYCEGTVIEPDLAECYKWFLLAKKYATPASVPAIEESITLLDQNLDEQIRTSGKQLYEDYDKKPQKVIEVQPVKEKGFMSNMKDKLLNSKEDEDIESIKKPQENEVKQVIPESVLKEDKQVITVQKPEPKKEEPKKPEPKKEEPKKPEPKKEEPKKPEPKKEEPKKPEPKKEEPKKPEPKKASISDDILDF